MPDQSSPRRKLAVDLAELEMAFEDASAFASHFFDLETGQVIMITEETRGSYEEIDQGLENAEDFEQALQERNLHDWQRDALREADQVEIGYGVRYIRVPQSEPHEAHRDMEDFIDTVAGERLQERLWDAIRGRGAFRRFKFAQPRYSGDHAQTGGNVNAHT